MPNYQKATAHVTELANDIMCEFDTHKPLLDAKVKVDFIFAYGTKGGDAIRHNGVKALGKARKVPPKERCMGRGDAEILIDAEWWNKASEAQRRALLDHELHHLGVDLGKRDDLGRPILMLRRHDVDIGWFSIIAERHGAASIERVQAKQLFDEFGQAFWPMLVGGRAKQ